MTTKPATKPDPRPPRTPDTFQRARSIYLARARHFEKAVSLLEHATPEVRALVEAHEEADAQKSIDLVPSSPMSE